MILRIIIIKKPLLLMFILMLQYFVILVPELLRKNVNGLTCMCSLMCF